MRRQPLQESAGKGAQARSPGERRSEVLSGTDKVSFCVVLNGGRGALLGGHLEGRWEGDKEAGTAFRALTRDCTVAFKSTLGDRVTSASCLPSLCLGFLICKMQRCDMEEMSPYFQVLRTLCVGIHSHE